MEKRFNKVNIHGEFISGVNTPIPILIVLLRERITQLKKKIIDLQMQNEYLRLDRGKVVRK